MDEGLPANTLVEQIRSAFEHEISFSGPLVALDHLPAVRPAQYPGIESANVPPPTPASVKSTSTTSRSSRPAPPAATAGVSGERQGPTPTPVSASSGAELFQGDTTTADRFEALIPKESPLLAFGSLSEVEKWAAATVLIPLDEIRLNPVFGVGNPEADLMVIGEAPGADEDKHGEPFVGRAGQLLTQILAAIGFERSDVYIANILKSRPPNNRDPLTAEIEAHIPILYKQIALICPRVILCVGKTAGNSLLGLNTSLKSLRGTFHDYHGVPVMVTYHPAALLRNPDWKRPTWEDVQKLRAMYDRLTVTDM